MADLLELSREAIEAAYREGHSDGYAAGRLDGQYDGTTWGDQEADWQKSKTRAIAQSKGSGQ